MVLSLRPGLDYVGPVLCSNPGVGLHHRRQRRTPAFSPTPTGFYSAALSVCSRSRVQGVQEGTQSFFPRVRRQMKSSPFLPPPAPELLVQRRQRQEEEWGADP